MQGGGGEARAPENPSQEAEGAAPEGTASPPGQKLHCPIGPTDTHSKTKGLRIIRWQVLWAELSPPPKHPGPQNLILVGNRVLADGIVKMRSSWG